MTEARMRNIVAIVIRTGDCTMDQMIDHCVQFVDEFNKDADLHYTKEEAVANMKLFFPTLKRWAVQ